MRALNLTENAGWTGREIGQIGEARRAICQMGRDGEVPHGQV